MSDPMTATTPARRDAATGEMTMPEKTLQDAVGEWGEATFPHSTLESIMAHLREEVAELDYEVRSGMPDSGPARYFAQVAIGEEAADCYLLLLHLAHRANIDLEMAAREKFAEIQTRTWRDDGRGYARHVDEQETRR